MEPRKRRALWALWIASTLSVAGALAVLLASEKNRKVFLPGPTSHGHHQIELACGTCHTDAFGGREVIQEACLNCHKAELKVAKDSHPKSKFTDPRNVDRIKDLDATQCVTCHVEHRPEITHKMLLTRPVDYCISCHRDVAKERPSHQGMSFETCASAGCHNFHDNRALYEDFLLKHAHEPWLNDHGKLPSRDLMSWYLATRETPPKVLMLADTDHPKEILVDTTVLHDWADTAHARAGVNCMGCHQAQGPASKPTWVQKPTHEACESCHRPEVKGFLDGKHGMRLTQHLPPMQPAMARIPMHQNAAHRELGCTSCHAAHRFDTHTAAAEACQTCHADDHSRAFASSPHGRLWARVVKGELSDDAGVSCSSCHMPRVQLEDDDGGPPRTLAVHNQNDSLRPNEKMIRPTCLHCHGMEFALDSLADPALIQNNFSGRPEGHVTSIDMALSHLEEDRRRREQEQPETGEQP